MSLYLHIPFCQTICSYCDFCKIFYQSQWIEPYYEAVAEELKTTYQGEMLSTIYLGGGTPNALTIKELERFLKLLDSLPKTSDYEYTVECNIELLTKEQLTLFKRYGINRISLGIQTITPHLKELNRFHTKTEVEEKIKWIHEAGIININADLMYALPGETMDELKQDLAFFTSLPITHISTYSLMLEPHTKLYIEGTTPIEEQLDADMYELILKTLKQAGFDHYEISNFARPGKASKHNLTYWHNQSYYGIGVGASGYIKDIRYTNTRSLSDYLKKQTNRTTEVLTKRDKMQYEMLLGLRLVEGVNEAVFQEKYGVSIFEVFKTQSLLDANILCFQQGCFKIPEHKLYVSNEILLHFMD